MLIPLQVREFLEKFKFVYTATLNKDQTIHFSIKGLVSIQDDKVYLFDLYNSQTYKNLKRGSPISISIVDEYNFKGYALMGKAELIRAEDLSQDILSLWEENVAQRISQRLIRNIQKEKISKKHPEAGFPHPKHLIIMKIDKIIDLAPKKYF